MLKKKLAVPLVHLNGTSKESLLEQLEEAYLAINSALGTLQKAVPNARDYYPYTTQEIWETARKQHDARTLALVNVMSELQALAEAIQSDEKSEGYVEATLQTFDY